MIYNEISFDNIKQLSFINELMNNGSFEYIALIQFDGIIDFYLLKDIGKDTINQLSYYLFIAYDIRSFNDHNIKILPINDQGIDQGILDIMSSYISSIAYDQGNYDLDPSIDL